MELEPQLKKSGNAQEIIKHQKTQKQKQKRVKLWNTQKRKVEKEGPGVCEAG